MRRLIDVPDPTFGPIERVVGAQPIMRTGTVRVSHPHTFGVTHDRPRIGGRQSSCVAARRIHDAQLLLEYFLADYARFRRNGRSRPSHARRVFDEEIANLLAVGRPVQIVYGAVQISQLPGRAADRRNNIDLKLSLLRRIREECELAAVW